MPVSVPRIICVQFSLLHISVLPKDEDKIIARDSSLRNKKRPEIATSCNSARRPRSTTQGARQSNFRLDSRPVAVARCLAMLLAHIGPDSQALEQPIRTRALKTQRLSHFASLRAHTSLPVLPQPQSTACQSRPIFLQGRCLASTGARSRSTIECAASETRRIVA